MDIATFEFITGVISLVTLIVFFVMASNISAIKKAIADNRRANAKTDYYINKFLGKNSLAYEALIYMFMTEAQTKDPDDWGNKPEKDPLRKKYEKLFLELGYEYPSGLEYEKL